MNTLSLNTPDETQPDEKPKTRPVIGFWKIALAVFVGNIMTGLLAAFLYSLR